ncbi:Speckle-type POZ protein B [Araneus ventricosus]|uniref:Speckle-type POZ protein B n=1 Tax=Araneus ventricosus TaxID=182803 RepID=A0A4Y2EIV8_ARAVE|nr:Speckle-type POZ protein B [Araneus ventricosus]
MSGILSSETDGFLFTWKVKNINVSFGEDTIVSPEFRAYNLYRSDWIMSLDPLSTRDGFNLNLGMTIFDWRTRLKSVSVILTVTVTKPNGMELVLKETEDFEFESDGSFEKVASFQNFTFSEDTLIFNCHIKKPPNLGKVPFVRCIAHTHIGSERRCCIWKVRKFASLLPDKQKKFTLFPTDPLSPEIKILGTLSNKSKFHIEVHVQSEKRIFIVGKISVLTSNDDLKWSKVKSFLVESESASETVLKFPLIIIRNRVLSYLRDDDLNLLCEFSLSTGTKHSEIDESSNITKEYSDLLKMRLVNLPTENSVLNPSTNETKKNSTPDTEDAICSSESKRTPQTLKEDLKKFYLQKNHCDVTFKTGTEILEAHKSILCSRSPVFSAMFDSDMKETINKKVEIVDMDTDTLDRFLLFLYSETLEDVTWDRATNLLYAANKYQVESLKVECSSFLLSNISEANVCEALKLSDLYQDEKLKSACQNLIFEQEARIFSSREWETLTVENPLLSAKTLQNHFAMKK